MPYTHMWKNIIRKVKRDVYKRQRQSSGKWYCSDGNFRNYLFAGWRNFSAFAPKGIWGNDSCISICKAVCQHNIDWNAVSHCNEWYEQFDSSRWKMCIRDRSRWSFHSENDSPLPTSLLSRCRAGCRGKTHNCGLFSPMTTKTTEK